MRIRTTLAVGMLATALALPLSGCFGLGSDEADDLANAITNVVESATQAAEQLQDVEWDKLSRAVVRDAATGDVIAEVTDQPTVEAAFAPFSSENGLTRKPKEPEEYLIEVWQPTTVKLGQDASDTEEIQVLEVTTYENSDVVTLTVVPIELTLHLDTSAGAADALRALAQQ